MPAPPRFLQELRGSVRLAVDGVKGVTNIVEAVHGSVARVAPVLGAAKEKPLGGITGLVYRSISGTTGLVGIGLDRALDAVEFVLQAVPRARGAAGNDETLAPQRDAIVSALNGVLGDHLERTANPLAMTAQLLRRSPPGPRPLLLVHGLCMNEQQWTRNGHDHGQALASSLGYNPFYLRYNTGRHVCANGASLAACLEAAFLDWPVPVESFAIIGHSMGGLVARSAVHQAIAAGMAWPRLLRQLVFLGTPHHGAPLERVGNWLHRGLGISPYAAPFTRLSGLRSAGITDLRHGNVVEADWSASRFKLRDTRAVVPLPPGVACFALAGSLGREGSRSWQSDGLVSVQSALGKHARRARELGIPASRTWVATGVHHLDLLSSQAVYRKLRRWLKA